MKVFLTGANGAIGSAIRDKFLSLNHEVAGPSSSELDLSDMESVARYFETHAADFDVIVHCAGYNKPLEMTEFSLVEYEKTQTVNVTAFLEFRILRKKVAAMCWESRLCTARSRARGAWRTRCPSTALSARCRRWLWNWDNTAFCATPFPPDSSIRRCSAAATRPNSAICCAAKSPSADCPTARTSPTSCRSFAPPKTPMSRGRTSPSTAALCAADFSAADFLTYSQKKAGLAFSLFVYRKNF